MTMKKGYSGKPSISTFNLQPISIASAPQAAAQAIRDAIIEGRLKPGERLIEQKLAASLRIGQPTLREALKELEFQGFVCKTPQRGTRVASLTREDVHKIMEVRLTIEALAIERATERITPETESLLTSLISEMAHAVDGLNLSAFHEADVAFHRAIWASSGNLYLATTLEACAFRLFVFGALRHSRDNFLDAVQQHREILAGLSSRDPLKARDVFLRATVAFWNKTENLGLEAASFPRVVTHR